MGATASAAHSTAEGLRTVADKIDPETRARNAANADLGVNAPSQRAAEDDYTARKY